MHKMKYSVKQPNIKRNDAVLAQRQSDLKRESHVQKRSREGRGEVRTLEPFGFNDAFVPPWEGLQFQAPLYLNPRPRDLNVREQMFWALMAANAIVAPSLIGAARRVRDSDSGPNDALTPLGRPLDTRYAVSRFDDVAFARTNRDKVLPTPRIDDVPSVDNAQACATPGNLTRAARGYRYPVLNGTDAAAIDSGNVWRMADVDPCGKVATWRLDERPVVVTYTFELNDYAKNYVAGGVTQGAIGTLPKDQQDKIRKHLEETSRGCGLKYVEVTGAAAANANTIFRSADYIRDESGDLGGYAHYPGGQGVVTFSETTDLTPSSTRMHEIMHQQGGAHTFETTAQKTVALQKNAPPGSWEDDRTSSVLSYTENPCHHPTNIGPLDIEFRQLRYGLGTDSHGDDNYVLDENSGNEGLGDAGGTDTITAKYDGEVIVSLRKGADQYIQIGDSIIRIAPGPYNDIENADISKTNGGIVVGNDLDNHLIGSNGNDVIDPRGGTDRIDTGKGKDRIIVGPQPGTIYVSDFSTKHDKLRALGGVETAEVRIADTTYDGRAALELVFPLKDGGEKRVILGEVTADGFSPSKNIETELGFSIPTVKDAYECSHKNLRRGAEWFYKTDEGIATTCVLAVLTPASIGLSIYFAVRSCRRRRQVNPGAAAV